MSLSCDQIKGLWIVQVHFSWVWNVALVDIVFLFQIWAYYRIADKSEFPVAHTHGYRKIWEAPDFLRGLSSFSLLL